MSIDEKKLRNDFESLLRGEDPPPVELATAPRLEDWAPAITRAPDGSRRMTLVGNVSGHPKHPDGKQIETNAVVWIDRKWSWARTVTRVYELGDPAGREIPRDDSGIPT